MSERPSSGHDQLCDAIPDAVFLSTRTGRVVARILDAGPSPFHSGARQMHIIGAPGRAPIAEAVLGIDETTGRAHLNVTLSDGTKRTATTHTISTAAIFAANAARAGWPSVVTPGAAWAVRVV